MDTQKFKRLPYGNSNFESVMTENYVYIDKTRFIEYMENENNKYHFFIRPRKFGKSLFFSMLSHYYDVNRKDQFERLFGNLYIGQNPTPKKNAYLVMRFNFSGLQTGSEAAFTVDFNRKIEWTVEVFLNEYKSIYPEFKELINRIDVGKTGAGALQLAYLVAAAVGKQIFVIIDEYDHFANDLIAMGTGLGGDVYRRMVRANGLVRDFYETLKIGTSDVVDRIFITGISPVMMDDLTSGFNIADNLTPELRYNEMMGFTKEEVDEIMRAAGINPEWILVNMELYYNGYLFHHKGENRVYNPSMVLYLFNQVGKYQQPPQDIIDDNLKTDYGRLHRLVQNENNREKLMEIAKSGGIVSQLVKKFSIDRLYDDEYFVSLLFYMGLLTIDRLELGNTRLKIPNYTIRTIYWEYIGRLTRERNSEVRIDVNSLSQAIGELAYNGNPRPYIDYVSQNIFVRLSNRDLQHFDEKYIKIMLLNGLFQSQIYVPRTEMEAEHGYMDIYLQRSPLLPDIPFEWVWEIKYLKKSEESQLQAQKDSARKQLEKYRNSQMFAERTDVRYLSLAFIGKDSYELEEI